MVKFFKSFKDTASSTLCIVFPTKPNSNPGDIFLINLKSEVPPVVDNLGLILVILFTIFCILKVVLFGLVKKDSPETLYSILNLDLFFLLILLKILLSFFLIEFEECLLLNLILKVASASPGITLSAVFSMFIFVTSI